MQKFGRTKLIKGEEDLSSSSTDKTQTASADIFWIAINGQFVGEVVPFTHEVIDRRAHSVVVDINESK